jgi:hypothetical protein
MPDPEKYSFCSEFDIVEKTIDVVVKIGSKTEHIRIEALRERSGKYSTREYIERRVKLQPMYDDEMVETTVRLPYDLPSTNGDSADAVLNRALSFLAERCSKN